MHFELERAIGGNHKSQGIKSSERGGLPISPHSKIGSTSVFITETAV